MPARFQHTVWVVCCLIPVLFLLVRLFQHPRVPVMHTSKLGVLRPSFIVVASRISYWNTIEVTGFGAGFWRKRLRCPGFG